MKNKEHEGRRRLEEAIRLYEEESYDTLEETTGEIVYSEKYLHIMAEIQKHSRKSVFTQINRFCKRFATIAAALILVFGTSMSVSAVREPIIQFFADVREEIIRIFFDKEDIEKSPEYIEKMYLITALPENSQWLTQFINEKDITTTWTNETVDVTLIQATLDTTFFANTDPSHFEFQHMAGYEVAILRNYSITIYIWNTEEYIYYLVIKGSLHDAECEDMMESLTLWDWRPEEKGCFVYEN